MTTSKTTRAATLTSCLLASLLVPLAGPVGAAPADQGHFHDVGSEPAELCGLDVRHDFDVSGSYRFVGQGRDRLGHYGENVHGTESWTNLDTDKTFSHSFSVSTRDTKVTDNGDGTLTIENQGQGNDTYYDNDGNTVLRDPGQTRFLIVVDDGGTPSDPDDDELVSFEIRRESTGRNDTDGRDFCEDLSTFTA
jgi:hypothetical protein